MPPWLSHGDFLFIPAKLIWVLVTHQGTRSDPGPQDAGALPGTNEDVSEHEHAGKFAPSMSLLSLRQLTAPGMIQDVQTCYTSRNTQDRAGQLEVCTPHLTTLHMASSHFSLMDGSQGLGLWTQVHLSCNPSSTAKRTIASIGSECPITGTIQTEAGFCTGHHYHGAWNLPGKTCLLFRHGLVYSRTASNPIIAKDRL